MHWEHHILYVYSEGTGFGKWQWAANYENRKYVNIEGITEVSNELGKAEWELVSAMPINWPGGDTKAFQLFFKRPVP